ncbi:leucyl-tRNA synthetase [Lophium mytilinum]|uniref:leucine--tRNA ligase n=1 Tax=Lophium mytilinum TaxID=390894 RepID=A0A6A6QGY8_9PEZI|nr:leucyl-tRNA synthetase [Lophium mytilinum]
MQVIGSCSFLSMRWGCSRRPVRPLALYTLRRSYAATTNPGNESLKDHFGAIDAKWQARWQQPQHQPSPVKDVKKGKAYILPMFPYPSGNLHLGHLRVYTISDVLARFKQMQGYDVIHPIGWDAFGLPAENAAIERGVSPALWTLQNIASMKKQMKVMGGRWDWDREILTCDPSFYKHTQKLFLLLHERGLAYQAESMVNFDPVDKTVLANEQVDANGCSWRSGAKVQKIMLKQWFLKIKEFQQPLLDDLEVLAKGNKWPERVLTMQKHWLGKSEGAKIRFQLENTDGTRSWPEVEVYTTRIDTLFGAQYLALSTSHPIVTKLAETHKQLHDFVQGARKLPSDSKDGYKLPEIRAKNPLFSAGLVGLENVPEWIPVYTAPYVLDHYGSGAVMGIPGHDTRDNDFRQENTHSPANVKIVVTAEKGASSKQTVDTTSAASKVDTAKPFTNKGYVTEGFGKFSGMASDEASDVIIEALRTNNVFAEKAENWRLRDWLISRQRYWGTPIPIIHCDTCGPVPVPDSDLPIELPALADEYFIGKAGNPLQNIQGWKNTACPKCNAPAERETDTMDTFMDSSWYFMRFLDPANTAAPISSQKADAGLPVDVYVGGVEHAILHLLYARFISKFLATTPLWPSGGGSENRAEPFKQLITQGMVHGKTYSDPSNGRFLRPNEVDFTDSRGPRIKSSGLEPVVSYEKMSKSKYNGVDPGETIATHGADATRAHMLFQAPVSEVLEWNPNSISGIKRWFTRILRLSAGPWIPTTILENGFIPPKDQDTSLLEILKRFHPSDKPADPRSRELTPDESLVQALTPKEVELWLKTQSTIASVTDSYSNTHALNTVVSDLMSLTNRLWDTQSLYNSGSQLSCTLRYLSFTSLLRMLAPIAPAFAEECWERLHEVVARKQVDQVDHPLHAPEPTSEISYVRSIFSFGFPIHDPHIVKLLSPTQTCAVMIDGRLKFTTEIPMPPADLTSEVDEGGEAKRDNKAVVREWIRGVSWGGRRRRIASALTGRVWRGCRWLW